MAKFRNPFARQSVPVDSVLVSFETNDTAFPSASDTWVRQAGGTSRTVKFNVHSHGRMQNVSYLFLPGSEGVAKKFATHLQRASISYEVHRVVKGGNYEPHSL